MLTLILIILVISLLILVHEWGHFYSARKLGVRVEEFGFGFPPRIMSRVKNGIRYSINLFPLGGFVKISGEEDQILNPEKLYSLPPEEKKRYFLFQPAWKRFLVIVAGVLVNFVIV